MHKAKVVPADQRKRAAQLRYQAGQATFEELLCEEALTPEFQKQYQEYVLKFGKPAYKGAVLREIRLLRKKVYDRVRLWLIETENSPTAPRRPPWWSQVLPSP